MVTKLVSLLFGCRHRNLTRPITPAHRPGGAKSEAYVACLECGQQFQYDPKELRIGRPLERTVQSTQQAFF
jgi:hypothetical protein